MALRKEPLPDEADVTEGEEEAEEDEEDEEAEEAEEILADDDEDVDIFDNDDERETDASTTPERTSARYENRLVKRRVNVSHHFNRWRGWHEMCGNGQRRFFVLTAMFNWLSQRIFCR
ncbi:hypothetical protein [Escherichia coli]|uniref:hypothetical protein n=1 Tax=Escherichia coli TaxID=562 RepID=UPI001F116E32|nr:hypothetical protein [Escherichia coli]